MVKKKRSTCQLERVSEISSGTVMVKKKRSPCQLKQIYEEGILRCIISSLTLRDAVRTCILSQRWRHIWKQIPFLEFDSFNLFKRDILDTSICRLDDEELNARLAESVDKFIKAVDTVMRLHQGTRVEVFTIDFFLHKEHSCFIDKWVMSGIGESTKEFVLKLGRPYILPLPTQIPYDFPCNLFTGRRGSFIERLSLGFCSLKPPHEFSSFKYLKALDLSYVNVTERDLENFLSDALVLESLSIRACDQLVSLKISHQLGRLKYLHVQRCDGLQNIEFHAISLTTFVYEGYKINIIVKEGALHVAHAYICFQSYQDTISYCFTNLPIILPHLKTLFLNLNINDQMFNLPENSWRFTQLRSLIIIIYVQPKVELLQLASLLNAAPFMEKFELHIQHTLLACRRRRRTRMRSLPNCHHKHLKTVEISGFAGETNEIEFAYHLLRNSFMLKTMIIDPRPRIYTAHGRWKYSDCSYSGYQKRARKYLKCKAPANVEVVIL